MKYEKEEICNNNFDCSCPVSKCISLEPGVCPYYLWETPYYGFLPNGAEYKTYIIDSNSIKSIGEFKGVKRAIEVSF